MRFLILFVLFGFGFSIGANERVNLKNANEIIYGIDGANYRLNEDGVLVSAGMVVIGEESLRGACSAGRIFDLKDAQYDVEREDFYYTITNNTDSPVLVSRTSADMRGLFCATPFNSLEKDECLKIYEDDRFHSLVSITVNDEVLCDGWVNNHLPFCELSKSYEITNKGEENFNGSQYDINFVSASTRADCTEM